MRKVALEDEFARLLAVASEAVEAEPKPLAIEAIEKVEEALDCTVPNPILGYFAAGLADLYGTGKRGNLKAIIKLTETYRETMEENEEEARYNPDGWVVFEEDNGNYLGFPVDAARDAQSFYFFDHESMYTDTPFAMSLAERLREMIKNSEDEEALVNLKEAEPFKVEVIKTSRPAPKKKTTEKGPRVKHSKFGEGLVVDRDDTGKHEKWRVEFDSGEEKLLLSKFLEVLE